MGFVPDEMVSPLFDYGSSYLSSPLCKSLSSFFLHVVISTDSCPSFLHYTLLFSWPGTSSTTSFSLPPPAHTLKSSFGLPYGQEW